MNRAWLVAAAGLGVAGCEQVLGLPDPVLEIDAGMLGSCETGVGVTSRQFVIDALDAPTTSEERNAASFDIDRDDQPDNIVFSAISALITAEPAFDLQPTVDASLASGHLLQLIEAELGAGCAMTMLYEGEDRDMPVNPTDNFSGEESFRVVGNRRGRMAGTRTGAAVRAETGGQAELRLPLFRGGSPIELPLVEAQVRYEITDDGVIEGAIGGAIRSDVVDGVVIPSFAASLQAVVARDCNGTFPECCPSNSDGETMLGVFDANDSCAIELVEVRDQQFVRSIFAPDVDLYDGPRLAPGRGDGIKDAVSIGIGFTAVNAFFLNPIPVDN
ncbi:MAG TPA: hypothetical protein VM261_00470 [Kofleriaceae bacterium]|nr:hypothetical protein [Kofleriaceae bacterium]